MTLTRDEAEAILGRTRPPQVVIDEAVRVGSLSPCAKSKRGVVLYNHERAERWACGAVTICDIPDLIQGHGFNGPPVGFRCTEDARCRKDCSQICLHAEDRAIRASGILDDVHDLDLVHVKVVAGALAASGPPSCVACSKVIAEVQLHGVWLYGAPGRDPGHWECSVGIRCIFCDGWCRLCGTEPGRCAHGPRERHCAPSWRWYTPVEFHLESLRYHGMTRAYDQCRRYLGDNDATSPTLHCIRPAGHHGDCDNVKP